MLVPTPRRRAPTLSGSLPALVLLPALLLTHPAPGGAEADPAAPSPYRADIEWLAADSLEGRLTGAPGGYRAAEYIAARYRSIGLEAAGDSAAYFQPFTATTGLRMGPANRLLFRFAKGDTVLALGGDFVPLSISGNGGVEADVVFAGYGITAPELDWDDYAGVEAKDRIVLIFRHEPGERDSTSRFDGVRLSKYADLRTKLGNARDHGAVGCLVVTDPLNHQDEDDDLLELSLNQGTGEGQIFAAHVTQRTAALLFAELGEDPLHVQTTIDREGPRSARIPGVRAVLGTEVRRDRRRVANLAGRVPGRDPGLSGETILVGAHYDHLGRGESGGTLAPDEKGAIHNGADDNASGVAALLELARRFREHPAGRSLLFVAFTGEELGLLGSGHYAANPLVPLEKTSAMVNLDMVGRMRNRRLTVGGVGSSPILKPILAAENREGLRLSESESGFGPSDHTSFYARNVPVLFFFTGAHEDYHRPSDDADRIHYAALDSVVTYVERVVRALADRGEAIAFTKAPEDTGEARSGEGYGGGGYGPYLGTIPDFAEVENGVRITGVRDGSPAARAGLTGGDTIVGFDRKPVANLYDLTYALRERKPGDAVEIVYLRGGEERRTTAVLEKRKRRRE
jgi:hypothetical protein